MRSAVNQLVSSRPPWGRTWRSTSTAKFPHCNTKNRHSHRLLRGIELIDNKENQSVGDWQQDKPQRPPASSNIAPGISLLSTPSCSSVQPPLYQPFHQKKGKKKKNWSFARHLRFPLSRCKSSVFVQWAGECTTVDSHQTAWSKTSKIAQSHIWGSERDGLFHITCFVLNPPMISKHRSCIYCCRTTVLKNQKCVESWQEDRKANSWTTMPWCQWQWATINQGAKNGRAA